MMTFDDRGVVAVEFAIILATVGLAVLLGCEALAPVLNDWAINLQEQITTGRELLTELQNAECN
jgi:Flp pilus assembly pilin Flp